jgi:hypothetical protein
MRAILIILACSAFATGCAVLPEQTNENDYELSPQIINAQNDFIIYGNSTGPASWRTPREVSKGHGPLNVVSVEGQACQKELYWPRFSSTDFI